MYSPLLKLQLPFAITLILCFSDGVLSKYNNACPTFQDYLTLPVNRNCFYQEDMALNTTQLINKYAGEVETYKVTTEDGYILTMFRMPKPNAKKVILLQHPLFVDGRVWVAFNDSLAHFLWHEGYEVWINNMRGTPYSRGHVSLSYKDPRYWLWSIHEIGIYDISAQAQLINNVTNAQITLVGHSLGTTAGLIYGLAKKEEAHELIEQFVFMSMSATYKYNRNVLILVATLKSILRLVVNLIGWENIFFFLPLLVIITKILFKSVPVTLILIFLILSSMSGTPSGITNPAEFNTDVAVLLQTASWPTVFHYFQLMNSKTHFKAYDYGNSRENKFAYGTNKPPVYSAANFSVPILFFSGENDDLATKEDTEYLIHNYLPENLNTKHFIVKGMNHLDFQLGKNRKELFYDNFINNLV